MLFQKTGYSYVTDAGRKITTTLFVAALATFLVFYGINQFLPVIQKLSTVEIIAFATAIISIANVTTNVILHNLKSRVTSKIKLGVNPTVIDNGVHIANTVESMGGKRVIPKNVYLFIDKGVKGDDDLYDFPFLLAHEQDEPHCILGKRCRDGGLKKYPDDLIGRPAATGCRGIAFRNLRHLSSESILFVDPGETFREDAVLDLKEPGVYRATLVFTATNAECICTTRQFVFPEKGKSGSLN